MNVKKYIVTSLICLSITTASFAYEYDPNDFATEVIDYIEGTDADLDWIDGSPFNDPNNALGRPTVDTTGDNKNISVPTTVPIVSVYPAFRAFELITIGYNGRLILKFNHPVSDDKNNPYGIDFIIFGNAQQNAGQYWKNGDPNSFTIMFSSMIEEPAIVSVSQTGDINDPNQWYYFSNGPYADTFAPTFGRVYNPNDPNTSIGSWNLWWSNPTNPTIPLDPNLGPGDFSGNTVAYMSEVYGQSAGGTGFDIKDLDPNAYASLSVDPKTGCKWIQYVCIIGNNDVTPEIDAVSDVSCCGDYKHPFPVGDINQDCRVDYLDMNLLSDYWLVQIIEPDGPAYIADIYEDDIINLHDLSLITKNWFKCTWNCQ